MKIRTYYYQKNNPNRQSILFNDLIKNNDTEIDKLAIVQFLKFCYPLYNRTFLKNIKFGYCWSNGENLTFHYNEKNQGYFKQNEKKLWNIIKKSLIDICSDRSKIYGVGNSGGLDSRVILYILKQLRVKFVSYTFGDIPSDAYYIADKTAKILDIKNKHINIESNFLRNYWKLIINLKPMHSLMYSWYYSACKNLPFFNFHITGFNGDNMLGSHLSYDLFDIKKRSQLFKYIYNHYSYVSDDLMKNILIEKNLVEKSYDDYLKFINNSENKKRENIFEEFNFKSRQLRFITNSINFDYCGKYHWDSPFSSKIFMDFALNLSLKERLHQKLYLNTVKLYMKELKNLRFERNFKSANDNKFKTSIKRILWEFNEKFNLNLYYKGSHKNLDKWLLEDNSLQYIYRLLKKKTVLFDKFFNTNYILKNFDIIYKKNRYLVFNLLTVKLWLENIYLA